MTAGVAEAAGISQFCLQRGGRQQIDQPEGAVAEAGIAENSCHEYERNRNDERG
jgi:hypothetical protein